MPDPQEDVDDVETPQEWDLMAGNTTAPNQVESSMWTGWMPRLDYNSV